MDERRVQFDFGEVILTAVLRDTPTADAVWNTLPIEATAMTWGEEVYFSTPVSASSEPGAKAVVDAGEIAFWPDGDAIAIGFGETPISAPGEIRLAAACNIWAEAVEDVRILAPVAAGTHVLVDKV